MYSIFPLVTFVLFYCDSKKVKKEGGGRGGLLVVGDKDCSKEEYSKIMHKRMKKKSGLLSCCA